MYFQNAYGLIFPPVASETMLSLLLPSDSVIRIPLESDTLDTKILSQ